MTMGGEQSRPNLQDIFDGLQARLEGEPRDTAMPSATPPPEGRQLKKSGSNCCKTTSPTATKPIAPS